MKYLLRLVLIACLPIAGLLLYTSMRLGPGVSPDSVVYMQTALNLLSGRGFTAFGEPMTHFAPFYSIVLALGGVLPIRILSVARLLQPAIFVFNAALFMFAVWTASRNRSIWAAAAAGGFFLTSAQVLFIHSNVWSEGLFFLLFLSGYILLVYYLESNRRTLLILSSVLIGLAIFTRYAGFALIPPVVFILMIGSANPMPRKIKDAGLAVMIAVAPTVSWMIHNLFLANSATNRELAIHLFGQRHLNRFYQTVLAYFWPSNLPDIPPATFAFVFFCTLLIIALLYFRQRLHDDTRPSRPYYLVLLNLSFAFSYLIFLIVSISFVDAAIPMDSRLLFPFMAAIVISLVAMVCDLVSRSKRGYIVWAPLALVFVTFLGYQGQDAARHLERLQHEGIGYQNTDWVASRTVDYLQSINLTHTVIFTNDRDVIAHRVGIDAFRVPHIFSGTSLLPNEQYQDEMSMLCDAVQDGGIIVYFTRIIRDFNPKPADIEAHCNLQPALVFSDGYIYQAE
ncbi:MAG TPA: hypothetical protein VLH85_05910 [Levilinea sp.]|nr:hypothetical protein [Levilinea sp.]